MAEVSIPQPKHPWVTLGYEPVRGLMNRHISRYLRAQRKNMRRFFTERGLLDLALRLRQIRKSRQGMLAKNRMFQEVLNDYTKLVNPAVEAATQSAAETADQQTAANPAVEVQTTGHRNDIAGVGDHGNRSDAGASVPEVAGADGAGVVIEE